MSLLKSSYWKAHLIEFIAAYILHSSPPNVKQLCWHMDQYLSKDNDKHALGFPWFNSALNVCEHPTVCHWSMEQMKHFTCAFCRFRICRGLKFMDKLFLAETQTQSFIRGPRYAFLCPQRFRPHGGHAQWVFCVHVCVCVFHLCVMMREWSVR